MDEIYHIFTRSIAGFKIFNSDSDFLRIKLALQFYQWERQLSFSLSRFSKFSEEERVAFNADSSMDGDKKIVEVVAYCFMPTHVHLILKQLKDKGISNFMSNVLNSYTRYFNIKHKRKGPLWEGRFKKILIESDEQLIHLTRYIHLNPVTACIVDNPCNWQASSFQEYIIEDAGVNKFCNYRDIIDINPKAYRDFVEDRIAYQRELAKIKDLIFDD